MAKQTPRLIDSELSDKVVAGRDVTDDEIRLAFSLPSWTDEQTNAVITCFRYAQKRLGTKRREQSKERAFCHSLDGAIRLVRLGFNKKPDYIALELLHDVEEDACKDLAKYPSDLEEIESKFGTAFSNLAKDLDLITHKQHMILNSSKKIKALSSPCFVEDVQRYLKHRRSDLSKIPHINIALESLIDFLEEAKKPFSEKYGEELCGRIKSYEDLSLFSYSYLFIPSIIADAKERNPCKIYDGVLIDKAIDIIDNFRTDLNLSFTALMKRRYKATAGLDALAEVIKCGSEQQYDVTLLKNMHKLLLYHVADKMYWARNSIDEHLKQDPDSRIEPGLTHELDQINYFLSRYKIEEKRIMEILRQAYDEVCRLNLKSEKPVQQIKRKPGFPFLTF